MRRAISSIARYTNRGRKGAGRMAVLRLIHPFRRFRRVSHGRCNDRSARGHRRRFDGGLRAGDRAIIFHGVSVGPIDRVGVLVRVRIHLRHGLSGLISGRCSYRRGDGRASLDRGFFRLLRFTG